MEIGIITRSGLFTTSASFVIMQICLDFCYRIHEDSSALLRKWMVMARELADDGLMKRVVLSTRENSIPAGQVGIFDRDTKMNYFNQVANYSTNFLIAA